MDYSRCSMEYIYFVETMVDTNRFASQWAVGYFTMKTIQLNRIEYLPEALLPIIYINNNTDSNHAINYW